MELLRINIWFVAGGRSMRPKFRILQECGQYRQIITGGAGGAAATMGSTRVEWKRRDRIYRVPPLLIFFALLLGEGVDRAEFISNGVPVSGLQLGGGGGDWS
jgi:hypothetical protein